MSDLKLVIIAAFLLAATACGSESDPIALTDADSTDEVLLEAGEPFEVRLESNPSTGYQWELAALAAPRAVELRSRDYIEPSSDLVGAPGEEVFVFEAIEGAEILRLEYIRPFDEPVIPERVVEFIIRVDDAPWPPDDVEQPSTSTARAPVEVADLLAGATPTDAIVVGYVVIDGGGSRFCETLAESFPPQCGGASVEIVNPDALVAELQHEQSVRWTDDRIQLAGSFDGSRFTLTE